MKSTLAAAKRSTGAPFSICLVKSPVEPKLYTTLVLVRASNCLPIASKAGVKYEAAATCTSLTSVFEAGRQANTNTRLPNAVRQSMCFAGNRRLICWEVVRRVEIDNRTANLISVETAEWRCINVYCNEILATYLWITELMNIGNAC